MNKTLQMYLMENQEKGIIDHKIRSMNGASFYIHPDGFDGDTLDFFVDGNVLVSQNCNLFQDTMTFNWALVALKAGRKAARKGWNGKGMFIYLVDGRTIEYAELRESAKDAADIRTSIEGGENGSSRFINPHIDMIDSYGQMVIGWTPTQDDMLAEDWFIVA